MFRKSRKSKTPISFKEFHTLLTFYFMYLEFFFSHVCQISGAENTLSSKENGTHLVINK